MMTVSQRHRADFDLEFAEGAVLDRALPDVVFCFVLIFVEPFFQKHPTETHAVASSVLYLPFRPQTRPSSVTTNTSPPATARLFLKIWPCNFTRPSSLPSGLASKA